MSKLFISYSHRDESWKDRLTVYLKVLEREGHTAIWYDRKIEPGDTWRQKIFRHLQEATVAILIITPHFLASEFIMKTELPLLLERRRTHGLRLIPVIAEPCNWKLNPDIEPMQLFPNDGKPLSDLPENGIKTQLADLTTYLHRHLSPPSASNKGKMVAAIHESPNLSPPPQTISFHRLPQTGSNFVGRRDELLLLDHSWTHHHTHIVILRAWGGVGKTALLQHWLNQMEADRFRGAVTVYGWSFYSQGAAEGRQASADEFFFETLAWFGDPEPGAGSPVDRARRLAGLIKKEKTLLLLDGLEPLQHPPGNHGMEGQLKDKGLKMLLKLLAEGHEGLCLITTRQHVADLEPRMTGKNPPVLEKQLEQLGQEAGVALLRQSGVKGTQKELIKAVKEYHGHALALTLLGRFIARGFNGDIRKRDLIPALTREERHGGHARRVMAAYETWLAESPELGFLRIMGLFDRPATWEAVKALLQEPVIPGVTDRLTAIAETDLNLVVSRLRDLGLLAPAEIAGVSGPRYDCHPLVREHFADQLQQHHKQGWQGANERLYRYYCAVPIKDQPDTLAQMEPLFAAMNHGCRAGLHQEVAEEVYLKRIIRSGKENYCCNQLGAFGADLAGLSHLFESPWSRPSAGLSPAAQAWVLSLAAFRLRGLGRLTEAIPPMQAGLTMHVKHEHWENAAREAGNLSELLLCLGRVPEAVDYGDRAVAHADKSDDWEEKMVQRTTHADALHQAGRVSEAEALFKEAEAMQKKRQPSYPFLYSLWGYRFCDLLLGQGNTREVLERAETTLKQCRSFYSLLSNALDHLSLGRARMQQAEPARAGEFLHKAVDGLREAGDQMYLPRGLLARAAFFGQQRRFDEAWTDLLEAKEIAELGGMKRWMCDYYLEAARVREKEGIEKESRELRRIGEEMAGEMGYLRRVNLDSHDFPDFLDLKD